MFNPEDCIGIPATDYLLDLGFDVEPISEYVGDEKIDDAILQDDSHPMHSEVLSEYCENLESRLRWNLGSNEIIISWSSGDILSYSNEISSETISFLKLLINNEDTIYVSNEQISKLESNVEIAGEEE